MKVTGFMLAISILKNLIMTLDNNCLLVGERTIFENDRNLTEIFYFQAVREWDFGVAACIFADPQWEGNWGLWLVEPI